MCKWSQNVGQQLLAQVILGFVGLCRHNFVHNVISGALRHNAGIILIFLQHNAVVSENCENCMQILPATSALECTKLIKVGIFLKLNTSDSYPVHFGIIEGLFIILCQASKLVYSSWICIIGTCS